MVYTKQKLLNLVNIYKQKLFIGPILFLQHMHEIKPSLDNIFVNIANYFQSLSLSLSLWQYFTRKKTYHLH